eukprot:gene34084-19640_t
MQFDEWAAAACARVGAPPPPADQPLSRRFAAELSRWRDA